MIAEGVGVHQTALYDMLLAGILFGFLWWFIRSPRREGVTTLTFGVWYGSLALETTIRETAYHMVKEESGIEGNKNPIYRERAVYLVHCRGLLIDLSGKDAEFPALTGADFGFTRQIGERLHREGHPGLLAPSARHRGGTNLVALSPAILSDPRLSCYLAYTCDPARREVTVERTVGKVMTVLSVDPRSRAR